jgi:DNA-binding NarL/FixJ family response regulator
LVRWGLWSAYSEPIVSLFPELTRRDQELLQLMLAGSEVEGISASMGIQLSSAATYIKRLYRKLGISGQRELLALATQRKWSSIGLEARGPVPGAAQRKPKTSP